MQLNYIKHQKVIENNERSIIELNESVTEELEYYEQCLSRLENKLLELSEKQRLVLISSSWTERPINKLQRDWV